MVARCPTGLGRMLSRDVAQCSRPLDLEGRAGAASNKHLKLTKGQEEARGASLRRARWAPCRPARVSFDAPLAAYLGGGRGRGVSKR